MTEVHPIGDLIETLIDYRGKTPPKTATGVPLITAKVIKGGRITSDHPEFIAEEFYAAWMRRGLPQRGDILITTEAPLGEVAQIGRDARVALAQRVILLRPDRRKVDPQFFFHYLRSPEAQSRLRQRSSGTTVSGIRQPELRAVQVSLLPRRNQEVVGRILDSLDHLIENSRRRIELLEQIAHTIYREWFVRFRYPGHEDVPLVDSPLGPIPEGWEVSDLFDVAEVAFGFSFKAKHFAPTGPFGVVRIRDVPAGITKTFTDERPPLRYRIIDGDVLIGMDGDFHLRQWTGGEAWLNQRVARLRPLGNLAPRHLLLAIEKSIQDWNLAISGTTVAHLGKRHLEQVRILLPPACVLAIATPILADLAHQERVLVQSSRKLATIRDLLLPKLVTGQIDVSNLDLDALVDSVA